MKSILATVVATACLLPLVSAQPQAPVVEASEAAPLAPVAPVARGWIVKKADNLCGLRDAAQLSNPGTIYYNVKVCACVCVCMSCVCPVSVCVFVCVSGVRVSE